MQPSGTLSSTLGLATNLFNFAIPSNTIEGTIPTELGNLRSMRFSDFSDNRFFGPIPSELGNWESSSGQLYLSANQGINGTIPTELGRLQNVEQLHLYGTSLSGTLPTELGRLQKVLGLYLHNNLLDGTIVSSTYRDPHVLVCLASQLIICFPRPFKARGLCPIVVDSESLATSKHLDWKNCEF